MKRVLILLQPGAAALITATVFLVMMMIGVTAAESDNHMCGCTRYSSCDCDAGRCCSPVGFCGSGEDYCGQYCYCGDQVCNDCHCDGTCCGNYSVGENLTHAAAAVDRRRHHGDEDNIIIVATYDDDGKHNISSSVTSPSPSPSKVSWPVHGYGSAAVCGQSSTMVSANSTIFPGRCLEVTNVENGKQAMVRVTGRHKQYHYCSNTSLVVDRGVFQQLVGTSGGGGHGDVQARHFPIRYKYVRCMSICN